jgi:hypothetical protein
MMGCLKKNALILKRIRIITERLLIIDYRNTQHMMVESATATTTTTTTTTTTISPPPPGGAGLK